MTLRAATLLGPNTVAPLRAVVDHLCVHGHDIEVIESGGLSGLGVDAADAVGSLDLVWACGLLTTELVEAGVPIEVVAAPTFPDEVSACYRSVVVARAETVGEVPRLRPEDFLRLRVAVNEIGSWSGYRGLLYELISERNMSPTEATSAVTTNMVTTGAHIESIAAVAHGRADIAAIDHSIWEWTVVNQVTSTDGLVVVDQTADWPAPPFSIGIAVADRGRLAADLMAIPAESLGGIAAITPTTVDDYRFMTTFG